MKEASQNPKKNIPDTSDIKGKIVKGIQDRAKTRKMQLGWKNEAVFFHGGSSIYRRDRRRTHEVEGNDDRKEWKNVPCSAVTMQDHGAILKRNEGSWALIWQSRNHGVGVQRYDTKEEMENKRKRICLLAHSKRQADPQL
jgi:hypothetical protein